MRAGDVLCDRFEILARAGAGGMGTVYRARDRTSGGVVALKVVQVLSEIEAERFAREAAILAELTHPAIVRYLEHGELPWGDRYLAMEWLEGETLSARLARAALNVREAVDVARQVADALAAAHARGIVHRDVKPTNICLASRDVSKVKVLDFGVATREDITHVVTLTGAVVGTPGYMAPEQARGVRELDARADVFALGCVLYRCITGRAPFTGETAFEVMTKVALADAPRARDLWPEMPEALDEIVAQMMFAQRLTGNERRFVSVVMALVEDAHTTRVDAQPAPPQSASSTQIEALVGAMGITVEWPAPGTLIATVGGRGTAHDHAVRAARCALAIHASSPMAPIAVATGRAIGDRITASGEAGESAAALLEDAAPGVRLDDVTAGLLESRFEIDTGTRGHALLGERHTQETTRAVLGRATPFVGRETESTLLASLLDTCCDEERARVAIVTGPAGVGKSRLWAELARNVARRSNHVEVLTATGDPAAARAPFGILGRAVRRAAGILGGEPAEVRWEKLHARVSRHVAADDITRVAIFLGEMVGVPAPSEEDVQLRAARQDALAMGDQMRRAWEDFLDAELKRSRDRRLMVLVLGRPDVHDQFPRLFSAHATQEIRLGELGKRSCERLVRAIAPDLDAAIVTRVVERAEGNAFYLEELLRAVLGGDAQTLPDTVLGTVEARLSALSPEARRLLRAASVFGQAFWIGGVRALLGLAARADAHEINEATRELVDRDFIEERRTPRIAGERELEFRHALVREAAYAMLTEEDRVLGHRLAGAWLERVGENEPAALASHFERGGDAERAVAWYVRAAQHALAGDAFASAIALADRGLACGASGVARGELYVVKMEALLLERLVVPAMHAYAEATLARTLLASGRTAEALVHARRAEETLRTQTSSDAGESWIRLAFAEALIASCDAGAKDALAQAKASLLARTARLPKARQAAFLAVPHNARTLELADGEAG